VLLFVLLVSIVGLLLVAWLCGVAVYSVLTHRANRRRWRP